MLVLLLSLAHAQSLEATPLEALTLRFDSRYDLIDWGNDRERLQNSALVAAHIDLFAGLDLAFMASTGPRFQSRWSTYYDLNGGDPERMALSLRQLFVERWFGDVRIQAGSIPPVKGQVSTSGLEDIGWIDGARVEWHSPIDLVIEVVGGSLTDIDEPDLFIRRRELDYAELELSQDLPHGLQAELAYHTLGHLHYTKAEAGWKAQDADGRGFTVRAEGALEVTGGGSQAVLSGETDLGVLISGNTALEGRLELESSCRWIDPDYGVFGSLAEDFYQFGGECRVRVQGSIDRNGRLLWSLRHIAPMSPDLVPRFDAVISTRLKLKRQQ